MANINDWKRYGKIHAATYSINSDEMKKVEQRTSSTVANSSDSDTRTLTSWKTSSQLFNLTYSSCTSAVYDVLESYV